MAKKIDAAMQSRIDFYLKYETDEKFSQQVRDLQADNNTDELYDRFYTELEFGTGGIRGVLGGGTNRLNPLVAQRVAAGWAEYLLQQFPDLQIKVVIAYDSRHYSREFASLVSEVLCAKGIRVFRYPDPRPTPQLSFSIRALQAQSGMVITASHNPPEYNGLKIYWNDGAQIVKPHDEGIMAKIAAAVPPFDTIGIQKAKEEKLYEELDEELDEKFQDYASALILESDTLTQNPDYKVVYTPLHGTGAYHMEALLTLHGVQHLIEPTQRDPDGNFPTVSYPNPEVPEALSNAVKTAREENAQLVLATDPDADRVGVVERRGDEFTYLTGNQIGALLLDYIATRLQQHALLPENGVFINTIVTSSMQEKIAESHGLKTIKTYTGFKNIAEAMKKIEESRELNFVFSCEESYGYLPSMAVRDKDGIATSLLCVDMAKFYKSKGMSLQEKLDELFIAYGYHEERTINKNYEGKEGRDIMRDIMRKLRSESPKSVDGQKIYSREDYKTGKIYTFSNAKEEELTMAPADVLIFTTEQGDRICVRPSGTEPKIKLYLLYSLARESSGNLREAKIILKEKLNRVEKEVKRWLQ